MNLQVRAVRPTERFERELKAAPPDVAEAARQALKMLLANSRASSLRLHTLKAWGKPTIFKMDVMPNRAWQITLNVEGDVAVLLRLATHAECDRNPRGS